MNSTKCPLFSIRRLSGAITHYVEKKGYLVECCLLPYIFDLSFYSRNCMSGISKNIRQRNFQIVLWMFFFVTNFISNLQYDPLVHALVFAILSMVFYAAIIYGNAYWLIPRFYDRRKYIAYAFSVLLLLSATVFVRSILADFIVRTFTNGKGQDLAKALSYSAVGALWIFFISVMYRLALNYFALSKKQNEIDAEKARTELHSLKQQIHPHFLFNTLNNIYYVAHKDSPEAAELIERLSGIIRYFIEESRKDVVYLQNEIELLRSYIELETIRMRYEMPVHFKIKGNISAITIPPLLLLPLVENIFKHGVDKRNTNNFARISLKIGPDRLTFTTLNRYFPPLETNQKSKTGLFNLGKRLKLYYENNYELIASKRDHIFISRLQIPVYEN